MKHNDQLPTYTKERRRQILDRAEQLLGNNEDGELSPEASSPPHTPPASTHSTQEDDITLRSRLTLLKRRLASPELVLLKQKLQVNEDHARRETDEETPEPTASSHDDVTSDLSSIADTSTLPQLESTMDSDRNVTLNLHVHVPQSLGVAPPNVTLSTHSTASSQRYAAPSTAGSITDYKSSVPVTPTWSPYPTLPAIQIKNYDGGDDPSWYPHDDIHDNAHYPSRRQPPPRRFLPPAPTPPRAAPPPTLPEDDDELYRSIDEDPGVDDFGDDEDPGMNSREQLAARRGRLVTFYRNGDPFFKGLKTSVSQKMFNSLETLLVWLNEKIPTTAGVRYIFTLPDAKELKDVLDFVGGRSYVVSSVRKVVHVSYGSSNERFWVNKAPSAGKVRKGEHNLFLQERQVRSYPGSRVGSNRSINNNGFNGYVSPSGMGKPRILSIISNTHRDSTQKVILNPQTTQKFDDMLKDITSMIRMDYPPAIALYTLKPPHRRVQSISHMRRALKNHDVFLACGQELVPTELQGKADGARPPDPKKKPRRQETPPQAEPDIPIPYHSVNHIPHPGHMHASTPPSDRFANHYASPREQNRYQDASIRPIVTELPPVKKEPDASSQLPHPLAKPPHAPTPPGEHTVNHATSSSDPPILNHVTPPSERTSSYPLSPLSHRTLNQNTDRPLHNSLSRDQSRYQDVTSMRSDVYVNSDPASRYSPPYDPPHVLPPVEDHGRRPHLPYQKTQPEYDSVKVHIHGKLREFFVPRYGQVEPDGTPPNQKLQLDWVYGYRGRDSKNNLHVLPSGELVYYVGCIGVVFDQQREAQRHYTGHSEDITCMTSHPSTLKPLIATGQMSGKSVENSAHVRIWDPYTLTTYAVIGTDMFTAGLSCVGFSGQSGFSEQGALLLTIDDGDKHTMSVWDWRNDRVIAKTTTSTDTVVWGAFHPQDYTTMVTYGKQHVYFWKLFWDPSAGDATGKILRDKKSGNFEHEEVPKFVTSCAFALNGDVITGDSTGRLMVWGRDETEAYTLARGCSQQLAHAHNRGVFSLCMLEDGTLLSAGGSDIKAWDTQSNYRPVKERAIPDSAGSIRTVVPRNGGGADGVVCVGTTSNCLLTGSLQHKFNTLIQGPSEELWAVAPHPDDHFFVTAGGDCSVMKWDSYRHRLLWRVGVEKPCLSAAWDPSGTLVAVGTTAGRLIVLQADLGTHVASLQVANQPIDALKFSPDGNMLALGGHDCNVYVYDVMDDGHVFRRHLQGILKGHKNFVTYLDWSKDSKYLQTVSGDYDLLFWDVEEMNESAPQRMREVEWATNTCILGYNVLGAWSNLREGDDINTLSVSNQSDHVAVGDNKGSIRLYRYPCTAERPEAREEKKYTGHVTRVCHTFDDTYVLSSGGADACVIQWAIHEEASYR